MQISQLLGKSAERFNRIADLVCVEWSLAIASSGISSPCDRLEFNSLVNKIAASSYEPLTALHTITRDNHVHQKLSA